MGREERACFLDFRCGTVPFFTRDFAVCFCPLGCGAVRDLTRFTRARRAARAEPVSANGFWLSAVAPAKCLSTLSLTRPRAVTWDRSLFLIKTKTRGSGETCERTRPQRGARWREPERGRGAVRREQGVVPRCKRFSNFELKSLLEIYCAFLLSRISSFTVFGSSIVFWASFRLFAGIWKRGDARISFHGNAVR